MNDKPQTLHRPITGVILWLKNGSERIPSIVRWSAVPALLVSLVSMLYLRTWHSVKEFNLAVDHHEQLFQDFMGHYYPIARTISTASEAVGGYFYSAFLCPSY